MSAESAEDIVEHTTLPMLDLTPHGYYCEVCGEDTEDLIIVHNIAFRSRRVAPFSICPPCAQKISDALAKSRQ